MKITSDPKRIEQAQVDGTTSAEPNTPKQG